MVEVKFGQLNGNDFNLISQNHADVPQFITVRININREIDTVDFTQIDIPEIVEVVSAIGDELIVTIANSDLKVLQDVNWIDSIDILGANPTVPEFRDEEGFLEHGIEEPTDVIPDIDSEDWFSKLTKEEIITNSDGVPMPKLAGLRRLAKPHILCETSHVNEICLVKKEVKRTLKEWVAGEDGKAKLVGAKEVLGKDFYPYASVTFTVTLNDGRVFTDSADAYLGNCNDLGNYPTAVASARAEGRVLRKVLGIKEHVFEEVSSKDALEELTSSEDMPIFA
jgi:hypothetical protein